jgi:hypothetical protein
MRLAALPSAMESMLAAFSTQIKDTYSVPGCNWTPPAAQYVAPGVNTPWDGESLTLYFGAIEQGIAGQPTATSERTVDQLHFHATLWVQMLRAVRVQTGEGFDIGQLIPSMAEIDLDGQQSAADVAALVQAAVAVKGAYAVVPYGESFGIGPIQMLGPDGGLAGVRLGIQVSLD